ncbi:hypothetical protein DQP55_12510 [Mycolicibacterium sp. GF69]|uniref:hypothetical protein n=1 Tax=Mycolicibacterium sp. GF69 TaxID=2267251 RepID=UPI000DCDE650|nr:hypothetical protein [Mycolicibacterium sp. GF69]RAV12434.1 hypothetical protein DQP55_12510 [Mycolicibacterium sp. GF69]
MSVNTAAARAGVSPTTWRSYVNGYRVLSAGSPVQMIAPAATLARMAAAVGATTESLLAADRPDAAHVLGGGNADDITPSLLPQPRELPNDDAPFVPDPAVALIESRRLAAVPPVSVRKVAAVAGISDTTWRNIVSGLPRAGRRVKVSTAAHSVAKMADAVGASPDEIEAAGRPDAATLMRNSESLRKNNDELLARWSQLADQNIAIDPDDLLRLAITIDHASSLLDAASRDFIGRLDDGVTLIERIAGHLMDNAPDAVVQRRRRLLERDADPLPHADTPH